MFTMVLVPAGITMYTGIAGPIAGWGDGGATQEKLIGPPYVPKENYFNRQDIGNCFLCYRVLASEGNANRVGAALDRHIPRAYSPLESIYTNLDLLYFGQTATQFREALSALSGEGATGSQSVSFANTTSFMEVIRQQSSFPNGAWANATGSTSYLKGNNGAASLNANAAGLQAGIGRQLTPDVMIGAALGVSDARYSVSDLATQASLLSLNLGLYGIAKKDDAYASGALTYSRGDTTMHRSIRINELFNQQKSSFNTEVYSARLELGYRAKLPALNLTPFIAFQPAWLRQNTFDESAYGSGNSLVNMGLNYQSQTVTSLPGSIGLQLDRKTTLDNGWTLNPTLRVSWIHEFQPERNITAALNLLPGQTFTIYGASAPGNTAQAIAGLTASDGNNISGYLMLGADMSDRGQSIQGRIGLNILF
jgi:outer membrane autotransporter protein